MNDELVERLASAGCVAPEEEATELRLAGGGDPESLKRLVARRVSGEPLAWVTGSVVFAGHRVLVHPGVYVPRWQSEPLAQRAAELLPDGGVAADLCTGSGAIAVTMARAHPEARVVAADLDGGACRCAVANGVEVYCGHLADPLPPDLRGRFDVVTAVVPYVPTDQLQFLPRDVRDYEPRLALDGGPGGTRLLEEVVGAARKLLGRSGRLLLEVGGDQDVALTPTLERAGFDPPITYADEDGDLRAIEVGRTPA